MLGPLRGSSVTGILASPSLVETVIVLRYSLPGVRPAGLADTVTNTAGPAISVEGAVPMLSHESGDFTELTTIVPPPVFWMPKLPVALAVAENDVRATTGVTTVSSSG